jgi:flagellar protein FlaI
MGTSDVRKKTPLRPFQPDTLSDVEAKVDEILNAHREVIQRGKEASHNTPKSDYQPSNKKRPSFFYVKSGKKTSLGSEPKTEKQSSLIKPQKHEGLKTNRTSLISGRIKTVANRTKKYFTFEARQKKTSRETPSVEPKKPPEKTSVRTTRLIGFSARKKRGVPESLSNEPIKPKRRIRFGTKKQTDVPKKNSDVPSVQKRFLGLKRKKQNVVAENSSVEPEKPKRHIGIAEKKKTEVPEEVTDVSAPPKQFKRLGGKKPTVISDKTLTEATSIKTKRRIGFGKKKKKLIDEKTGATLGGEPGKKQDAPQQFDESVTQIKSDEASFIDQQIKLNETRKFGSVSGTQSGEKIQDFDGEKSGATVISEKSSYDPFGQPTTPKKSKLDEITPDGQIQYKNEANALKEITLQRLGYAEKDVEEIDFYPLHEPFAYVEIIREKESLDKRYVLIEMQLSEEESRLLKFMKETLTGYSFSTEELEKKGEMKYLSEKVDQVIDDYMLSRDPSSKKKIMYYLEKEFLGLGKLEVLMKDTNIEDISCDGSGVSIFLYHRRFGSLKSNVQFNDEDELSAFVVKLAQKCGKHISISEPMLDATMPDGSRIQMTLSAEVTTKGSTFTIRKFSEDPFSPPDLIEFNTMSSEMVAYMWLAVENGVNALIAGGTAAGKTSTMNAISLFIPRESKIVSIEETREINLPHPNWIPGVVRSGFGEVVGNKVIGEIDLYDLMKAALRQRPEYILVGEIRGKEAYVLFQAMATGHTTYSTVHADSAQSLIHRLEGKPIEIPRIMLQALDIVCIQVISRVKDKRARRCKQIIEIIDIDPTTKEILTNEVFHWDPIDDKFIYSGKSYILERIRAEKDIPRETMITEIKNRASLLEWMNKNNIREFKKVATVIAQYADNSVEVMKKVNTNI